MFTGFFRSFLTFQKFNAFKFHWSETRLPVVLEINQGSLDQKDPTSGQILASYHYKDIQGIVTVSDYPGGFVVMYDSFNRMVRLLFLHWLPGSHVLSLLRLLLLLSAFFCIRTKRRSHQTNTRECKRVCRRIRAASQGTDLN